MVFAETDPNRRFNLDSMAGIIAGIVAVIMGVEVFLGTDS